MRRGEVHFTGGCVEGASGTRGRCWLCGDEWEEENCCHTTAVCSCMALAESWRDISYKNVVLVLAYWAGMFPNFLWQFFWERWYS